MNRRKYIGKLISIRYNDRPTPIFGFVIDYNDEWTLLRYNPTDYINSLKLISKKVKP